MKALAVITARGGSKRIPKKNIKEFCGKPILSYSITAAVESGLFDEVMVSTDSKEIAGLAVQYGASVPFMRSEATANDYATTDDVLKEVLSEYEKRGKRFEVIVCIYPTAPFVTAEKLREAVALLKEKQASRINPVVRFSFPPQRAFVVREGKLEYQYPEFRTARSQDLEPIYHDCGQFYVMKTDSFLSGTQYENMIPYVIPETEVQDIDTEEDWLLAEMKYRRMQEKSNS